MEREGDGDNLDTVSNEVESELKDGRADMTELNQNERGYFAQGWESVKRWVMIVQMMLRVH